MFVMAWMMDHYRSAHITIMCQVLKKMQNVLYV